MMMLFSGIVIGFAAAIVLGNILFDER